MKLDMSLGAIACAFLGESEHEQLAFVVEVKKNYVL